MGAGKHQPGSLRNALTSEIVLSEKMLDSETGASWVRQWSERIKHATPVQRFVIKGGGTKANLILPDGLSPEKNTKSEAPASQAWEVTTVETSALSGIIDYQASEFTITAYAGTPIEELQQTLAQHGQYLPFDPPLLTPFDAWSHDPATEPSREIASSPATRQSLSRQSTIGGAIASGINGPGRWRFGGLRDFVLETRFIDGQGEVRRGGRRVVKNAAGFDIPKLLVGSCGRLGVMVDVTLKVFPAPRDYLTLNFLGENLETTLDLLAAIGSGSFEIDAIETGTDYSVLVRLAGHREVLAKHGHRIQEKLRKHCSGFLVGTEQQMVWQQHADWLWGSPETTLVKVPLNLRRILEIDEALEELEIDRRYGSCGNVAWLRWPAAGDSAAAKMKRVAKFLLAEKLGGLVVRGPSDHLIIGDNPLGSFYQRLKTVFDPAGRLGNFDAS